MTRKTKIGQNSPLFTTGEWTFPLIEKVTSAIKEIVDEELQLTYYPVQVEIVNSEQMLDAYASSGLPQGYAHWSYGKHSMQTAKSYQSGQQGLAYEIVINSNPCLAYCMEDNTMTMQTLVIAHAAFGHNAFFANNGMFREWTNPEQIIDYLGFAKRYIAMCEERYGSLEVEAVLDACHALSHYGVDMYRKPQKLSAKEEILRNEKRSVEMQENVHAMWDSSTYSTKEGSDAEKTQKFPSEPEENILYFLEKSAPSLPVWKREIIRINRKMAQYFYPQMQTKVMNEGFACFVHYYCVTRLHEKGLITEGSYLEFLQSHTNVVHQPEDKAKYSRSINPYALGFKMFMDIKRMCETPTQEDKKYFPEVAGSDWLQTIKFAVENFKDESFIRQYLSPSVIRELGLWVFEDDSELDYLEVIGMQDITNESDLRTVRNAVADTFDISLILPGIEVTDVAVKGDRTLTITFSSLREQMLDESTIEPVLQYLQSLWGYPVSLEIKQDGLSEEIWCVDQQGKFTNLTEAEDEGEPSRIVLN
jgi:stage V sporulation protein R